MLPPCATSVGGTDDQEHWAKGYHSHFPRNVNDLRPIPAAVRDYERHAPALPTRQIGSFAAPEGGRPVGLRVGMEEAGARAPQRSQSSCPVFVKPGRRSGRHGNRIPVSQDTHAPVPAAAELLAHAEFLRALARGILRDEHGAEDVVQDAFVAALEAPPRRSWSLRGWLAGVTRNLALMRVRSETRRAARERVVSGQGVTASPAEIAERLEAQRRLVTEVLGLEEPFRTTVVLHYFDSLSPSEIARRQGVPVKTVYSRLARGLDRLRERLLAGERDRFRHALVLIAGGTMATTASKTAIAAGILLLLAAAGGVLLTGREPESRPAASSEESPSGSGPGTPVAAASRPREDAPAPGDEIRRLREENAALQARLAELEKPRPDLPPEIGAIAVAQQGESIASADTALLRCFVFDREGRPQAGRAVEYHSKAVTPAEMRAGTLTMDATGRSEVADLPPGAYEVQARFPQGAWARWVTVEAGRATVVKFWIPGKDAGAVSGRVLRYGGEPVRQELVFASPEFHGWPGAYTSYMTKTDAEGRYTFEELPPGSVRITAHISIENLKADREVEVAKGGRAVADFVLGVPTVTGTVRDDSTGEPIAGVSLVLNWENREQWRASSDGEGRFAFRDAPPGSYFLHVDAVGYGGGAFPVIAPDGQPPDIDVRLRTAAILRVRVLTPEGSPYVGEVGLYPTWKEPPAPFRQAASENLRTDRDGRATFRKVAPGEYDLNFYSQSPDGSLADRMVGVVRSVRIVPGENEVEVQLAKK